MLGTSYFRQDMAQGQEKDMPADGKGLRANQEDLGRAQ